VEICGRAAPDRVRRRRPWSRPAHRPVAHRVPAADTLAAGTRVDRVL